VFITTLSYKSGKSNVHSLLCKRAVTVRSLFVCISIHYEHTCITTGYLKVTI